MFGNVFFNFLLGRKGWSEVTETCDKPLKVAVLLTQLVWTENISGV